MAALWYTVLSTGAVSVDGAPLSVNLLSVTTNYFDVLEVPALLGRTFLPEDEDAGDAPSMILSFRTWQNLFASDPNIVGKALPVPGDDLAFRVVGVLPPGVDYPPEAEAYAPLLALPHWRKNRIFEADVLARLAPGASIEVAQAELRTIRARLTLEEPQEFSEMDVVVTPLLDTVVRDVRRALWLLFGALGLVLLIAAANVACLTFARGAEREREIAIRVAMGAGRVRLTSQLLFETLVLSAVGGAAGLVLAHWGLSVLLRLLPEALPRSERIALDGTVLAFALGITILAALGAGLAPAWKASSRDMLSALRRGRGVLSD
jgi:predicted permease